MGFEGPYVCTYGHSCSCLRGAGFVQLLCGFGGPFGEFLAGRFVGLEIGYGDVGVVGAVAAEEGEGEGGEAEEGGHCCWSVRGEGGGNKC